MTDRVLLDTCVVIDVLRGHGPAKAFVEQLALPPALAAITLTELFAGMRSQKEEALVREIMRGARILPLTVEIAEQAGNMLRHYRRSHAVDVPDAIIAATAEHHGLELATLNIKHFPMFADLQAAY